MSEEEVILERSQDIRPLQCEYWGNAWTCTDWCELRNDFRVFRIDRIDECRESGGVFTSEPGKTYEDYLATLEFENKSN